MIFGNFSLFLIFYLSFKLNCYLIKSQKKGYKLVGSDVASGEASDATRGTRATARMRRGSKATWQGHQWPTWGAGDAWRGHVAKGHATMRTHVGARVGRHV